MEMRRAGGIPWQIRLFEALMLASVVLGATYAALGWATMGDRMASGQAALLHILCLAATLLLTLLVSRARSRMAKWLLILVVLLCSAALFGMSGDGAGLVEILQLLFELIALALLFTRPAIAYLEHKPSSV